MTFYPDFLLLYKILLEQCSNKLWTIGKSLLCCRYGPSHYCSAPSLTCAMTERTPTTAMKTATSSSENNMIWNHQQTLHLLQTSKTKTLQVFFFYSRVCCLLIILFYLKYAIVPHQMIPYRPSICLFSYLELIVSKTKYTFNRLLKLLKFRNYSRSSSQIVDQTTKSVAICHQ